MPTDRQGSTKHQPKAGHKMTTKTSTTAPAAATKAAVAPKATPAKPAAKRTAAPKVVAKKATEAAPKKTTFATADEVEAIKTANSKAPSDLHKNFLVWLESAGVENMDLETIKMVCALRHTFQKSEFNQEHLELRKEAAEAKASARIAAAKERAAKAVAKAEALAAAAKKK